METLLRHISYPSRASEFNFWFIGDVHLGAKHCDEEKFQTTIDRIARDPNALVFLMGDLGDFIGTRDKRFEMGLVADWIDRGDVVGSQILELQTRLAPIEKKVIGVLDGNHEQKVLKESSLRIKGQLLVRFPKWVDLGYSALVRIGFERKSSKGHGHGVHPPTLFLHHGWGGGRTYADVNHFFPLFAHYAADWFILGHTHKRYAGDAVLMAIDRMGKLVERRRLWGRSGTFLKTAMQGLAGYGEEAGYPPVWRGALMIRYIPETGEWFWNGGD